MEGDETKGQFEGYRGLIAIAREKHYNFRTKTP